MRKKLLFKINIYQPSLIALKKKVGYLDGNTVEY